MNQINLSNRVAVITGGAQGFGYAMVERFSSSGATVIIWDNDKKLMNSLFIIFLIIILLPFRAQNVTNDLYDKPFAKFPSGVG